MRAVTTTTTTTIVMFVRCVSYLKPALEHFYTKMAEKFPSTPQKASSKVRNSFQQSCEVTGPLDQLLKKHAAMRQEKIENAMMQVACLITSTSTTSYHRPPATVGCQISSSAIFSITIFFVYDFICFRDF